MSTLLALFLQCLVTINAVSDFERWTEFKNKHGKLYRTTEDEVARFLTFQSNLRNIEEHNIRYQDGKETYEMGVTQFSDLTQEEVIRKFPLPPNNKYPIHNIFKAKSGVTGASEIDWRNKGAVSEVQNQGSCSSCWAFSAAGSLEGQKSIRHNETTPLSVQELVDCTYSPAHCQAGWMYDAYKYVQKSGISAQNDYKYTGVSGACKNKNTSRVNIKVTGYTRIEENEEALRQAVEKIGPISVTLYHGWLASYKKGIFQHESCPTDYPSHAVLAVGYGRENGTDFWIMKNSWGKDWGEDGYFRIIRNKNNMCGICSYAMYPNVA